MNSAKQVISTAGRKTGTAMELSKMKLQVMQLRSQVQSTYERIGTLTYEQQKVGTDNYDLIVVCIQEVDELLTEINEINAKISEMKDGVVCSRCRYRQFCRYGLLQELRKPPEKGPCQGRIAAKCPFPNSAGRHFGKRAFLYRGNVQLS